MNNNNGYLYVLFQQRCEHRIRKKQRINSTVHDAN